MPFLSHSDQRCGEFSHTQSDLNVLVVTEQLDFDNVMQQSFVTFE